MGRSSYRRSTDPSKWRPAKRPATRRALDPIVRATSSPVLADRRSSASPGSPPAPRRQPSPTRARSAACHASSASGHHRSRQRGEPYQSRPMPWPCAASSNTSDVAPGSSAEAERDQPVALDDGLARAGQRVVAAPGAALRKRALASAHTMPRAPRTGSRCQARRTDPGRARWRTRHSRRPSRAAPVRAGHHVGSPEGDDRADPARSVELPPGERHRRGEQPRRRCRLRSGRPRAPARRARPPRTARRPRAAPGPERVRIGPRPRRAASSQSIVQTRATTTSAAPRSEQIRGRTGGTSAAR